MTGFTNLIGAAVANAYDFSAWETLMDVGGGNGILLSHILRAHKTLRGLLADVPHVLERASQRGYLSGDLAARSSMLPCNFFENVPTGARAYLMKSRSTIGTMNNLSTFFKIAAVRFPQTACSCS